MTTSMVRLLPERQLIRTGPVDHADWSYRSLLGPIQRKRFELIVRLLRAVSHGRLLEIGFGSGVFMPELVRHCRELHGIDIHPHVSAVESALLEHGIDAHLKCGSAEAMPYPDSIFDCVVAVSCLEFIDDIQRAAVEIRRVLASTGCLVFVTPGHAAWLDTGLRVLTGADASKDFGDRRERLLSALDACFAVDQRVVFPEWLGQRHGVYTAMRMVPRPMQ